jgi:hypothetical protein
MKIIAKQKQFSTAIKRNKVCNIELLLNDPEVDPAANGNWAISCFVHNWEVFSLLNSSDRVNPFENYRDNLIESLPNGNKTNKVFDYFRGNKLFKENILDCLYAASVKSNPPLFKELYESNIYKQKEKKNNIDKLLACSFLHCNPKIFKFLLEKHKEKEIDFSGYRDIDYYILPEMLTVIVSDKRVISHFDIEEILIKFIEHKKEKQFKILCSANVDYDFVKISAIVYKKFKTSYDGKKEYESMLISLIESDKSLKLCKVVKESDHYIYKNFKDVVDKKIMQSKVLTF